MSQAGCVSCAIGNAVRPVDTVSRLLRKVLASSLMENSRKPGIWVSSVLRVPSFEERPFKAEGVTGS